jgi:citrate synthase
MDLLRTATSFLGSIDLSADDRNPKALMEKSIALIAQFPGIVASGHRTRPRLRPLSSRPQYSHAKNFLTLLAGRAPQELESQAFDCSLILYAEHGFNASTFAARVTISTLSDLTSAIVAAIGTLKGALHGGANEKAMEMLIEIGKPKKARAWVKKALAQKKRIMGFGHREYRKKDARSAPMKRWALKVSESRNQMLWFDIASEVEKAVREEKGLFPNLDFYGAVLYYLLGIPIPLYTPIFAASRVAGWCAHVMEQLEDNRLIRPSSIYVGPSPRPFRAIERRLT